LSKIVYIKIKKRPSQKQIFKTAFLIPAVVAACILVYFF
jgi:hypothetical protein